MENKVEAKRKEYQTDKIARSHHCSEQEKEDHVQGEQDQEVLLHQQTGSHHCSEQEKEDSMQGGQDQEVLLHQQTGSEKEKEEQAKSAREQEVLRSRRFKLQSDEDDMDREDQEVLPSLQHLPKEDEVKFRALLREYVDVFSQSEEDVGEYTGEHLMVIETCDNSPVRQRAYRTPIHQRAQLQEQLQSLEEQRLIEPSTSPWASPVVLVRKRNNQLRFCCDYRAVNTKVKHDSYPLPRVEDLIQATGGARYFSVLDQRAAYWAIPLDEESKEVTAFITEYGLHQWTRMPFGMKTSPGSFQRIMEDVLQGMNWKQALVYLDDVVIFTKTLDEHLEVLQELLERYRTSGLKLNPSKCCIASTSVGFLGHQLDEQGIRPSLEKVQALRDWPTLQMSMKYGSFSASVVTISSMCPTLQRKQLQ